MESKYLRNLLINNRDLGDRYLTKLQLIDGLDPFSISIQDLNYTIEGVPPVTSVDVASYLFFTHNFYTKDQMIAYKSLSAFKYFESGFVIKPGTKVVNDMFIVVAKVKESEKVNLKPLEVWCIIDKDGVICTAHCTCMTIFSEVCSHIGAILYAAEYANNKKEAMSSTDIHGV